MLAGVSLVVFAGLYPSDIKTYPLGVPVRTLAVVGRVSIRATRGRDRLGDPSGIAVWGTVHGYGPFVHGTPNASLMLLQIYTAVTAIMSVVVARSCPTAGRARPAPRSGHDRSSDIARQLPAADDVLRMEIARSDRTGRDLPCCSST